MDVNPLELSILLADQWLEMNKSVTEVWRIVYMLRNQLTHATGHGWKLVTDHRTLKPGDYLRIEQSKRLEPETESWPARVMRECAFEGELISVDPGHSFHIFGHDRIFIDHRPTEVYIQVPVEESSDGSDRT